MKNWIIKNQKPLIYIGVAVALLIVIYFLFLRNRSGINKLKSSPDGKAMWPLGMGSEGEEVKKLQGYLIKTCGNVLPLHGVDGKWGDETQAAVEKCLKTKTVDQNLYKQLGM